MKHPKSPSPTWKSFLAHHITDLVAIDFFVVPTIDFKNVELHKQVSKGLLDWINKSR
ncbi:MAG: hypothetical protein ACREXR_24270 [Gammaproteobacteria bacterium]